MVVTLLDKAWQNGTRAAAVPSPRKGADTLPSCMRGFVVEIWHVPFA